MKKCILRQESTRGRIFSCVRPFNERAENDLGRSMHRSLWILVAHNSFIEGSHMTKKSEV
jgi:hypothetical protein